MTSIVIQNASEAKLALSLPGIVVIMDRDDPNAYLYNRDPVYLELKSRPRMLKELTNQAVVFEDGDRVHVDFSSDDNFVFHGDNSFSISPNFRDEARGMYLRTFRIEQIGGPGSQVRSKLYEVSAQTHGQNIDHEHSQIPHERARKELSIFNQQLTADWNLMRTIPRAAADERADALDRTMTSAVRQAFSQWTPEKTLTKDLVSAAISDVDFAVISRLPDRAWTTAALHLGPTHLFTIMERLRAQIELAFQPRGTVMWLTGQNNGVDFSLALISGGRGRFAAELWDVKPGTSDQDCYLHYLDYEINRKCQEVRDEIKLAESRSAIHDYKLALGQEFKNKTIGSNHYSVVTIKSICVEKATVTLMCEVDGETREESLSGTEFVDIFYPGEAPVQAVRQVRTKGPSLS